MRNYSLRQKHGFSIFVLFLLALFFPPLNLRAQNGNSSLPQVNAIRGLQKTKLSNGWHYASRSGHFYLGEFYKQDFVKAYDRLLNELGLSQEDILPGVIIHTKTRHEFDALLRQIGARSAHPTALAVTFSRLSIAVFSGEDLALQSSQVRLRTLRHEIVHLLLGGISKKSVERWYHEGIAQVFTQEPIDTTLLSSLRYNAKSDDFSTFETLRDFISNTHNSNSELYRKSLLFCLWLQEKHGKEVHQNILSTLSKGQTLEESIIEATGKSPQQNYDLWVEQLAKEFSWLSFLYHQIGMYHILGIILAFGFFRQFWRKQKRLRQMSLEEMAAEELEEERLAAEDLWDGRNGEEER